MSEERQGDGGASGSTAAPRVEGHRVVRRLGAGAAGVVWLLEDDDGARRAVKVPRLGPGQGGPDRREPAGERPLDEPLRGERWRVRGLEHPHLLRLHGLVPVELPGPDGRSVRAAGVLMDFASGGSVGSLMAARGTLSAAEVVTVTVPVAEALSALHARGIVHGDVSAGNILFTADGIPLLADFGQARLTGERRIRRATLDFAEPDVQEARPSGDVYALAAVAWWCLTGASPGPARSRPPLPVLHPGVSPDLAAALEEALSENPDERPGAREFATAVRRSGPAAPVQIAAGAAREEYGELATALVPSRSGPGPRRRSGDRWKRRNRAPRAGRRPRRAPHERLFRAVTVLLAALLGAAALGWAVVSGAVDDESSPSSPSSPVKALVRASPGRATPGPGASPDAGPRAAIAAAGRLLAARTTALLTRDPRRLDSVYGDAVLKDRDRALIARMLTERRRYDGYRPVLSAASVDGGVSADRAVLSVTVRTPSYLIVGDPGAGPSAAARRPAGVEELRLTLVRRDGGWRIGDVAPRG
ncbi:serine/threonine-protein kinase [Arthrobacter woluwensis]|uniref:Serine/threonine protein kinase n=1 Tax=Arthrobacter woluwensis TaxID=156980 RepID=A0A1H4QR16_9MICC|nr:serine/threonine-protein kinase [Arthrobacter woluwensis]SEC22045.1 Serine/threonine protein kinase [Arthrobacter woluwensis]